MYACRILQSTSVGSLTSVPRLAKCRINNSTQRLSAWPKANLLNGAPIRCTTLSRHYVSLNPAVIGCQTRTDYHKHAYSLNKISDYNWQPDPVILELNNSTHPFTVLYSVRSFHTSSRQYEKEQNVVEKTVKIIKDLKPTTSSVESLQPITEVKKSLGHRFLDELKHYYHGFRLFLIEAKISLRLLKSLLNGETLTRRERRQLVRSTSDVFRLVPFLVFIIVPFMEFLLPVAIKLFPNMLPSTFREENKELEKNRTRLKVKLEMAKFLQETIHDTALDWKNRSQNQSLAKDFGEFIEQVGALGEFIEQVRSSGEMASREDIIKYSKLFEDEITMDSFSRPQLVALCRLFGLNTIGTDNFLRFQLRMKLRDLKSDDKMIMRDGINTLTASELQVACRERGMRALGLPETRLKAQLQQWLDLHLKDEIPTTLLLLSRTMYLPEESAVEDKLKATISALSEKTAEKAKIAIAEVSGEKVDNRTRLDLVRDEEEAIKREKEEEARETALEEEKRAREASELLDADLLKEVPGHEDHIGITDQTHRPPVLVDDLDLNDAISAKDLEDIESAIENLANEKQFDIEKDELNSLKEDVSEYEEDLKDLKDVIVASGGSQEDIVETKAAQRMSKMLNKMIGQLDKNIGNLHSEKATLMEDLEMKEIKVKRSLQDDEQAKREMLDEIKETKHNVISINELVLAMMRLQKIPNEDRLKKIAEVLDEDKDGNIEVEHILKVVEELGHENVKLSTQQVSEVIRVLKEENFVESFERKESVEKKKKEEELKRKLQEETELRDTADIAENLNRSKTEEEMKR